MSLYRIVATTPQDLIMKELGSGTTINECLKDAFNTKRIKVEHPNRIEFQKYNAEHDVWVEAEVNFSHELG